VADIVLKAITKFYGSIKIIENLNLSIGSGEFVTLLGPSGSGKTTTLKIIAGLENPDSGSVIIGDKDVTSVPVNKRGIGMVFQNLALFPHMTAAENIAFGLRMRGIGRAEIEQRVKSALHLVQLDEFADRIPDKLSGGQQQRVALARAFVINPSVVLLDEPLGALDRKLREEMQIEIRKLVRELQMTAIFVTHDQEEALVMSDRIAVMNHGFVEQLDQPAVLFRRPTTAFVAQFMGVANLLDGVVSADGQVAIAEGRIRLPAKADPSFGRTLKVGLRPEDAIVTTAPSTGGDAGIACVVDSVIYQGAMIAIEMNVKEVPSLEFVARVVAPSSIEHLANLQNNQDVFVHWKPESILLYPK
jgi:spermidine/putrescine ABC transporter ATP-binding subunit